MSTFELAPSGSATFCKNCKCWPSAHIRFPGEPLLYCPKSPKTETAEQFIKAGEAPRDPEVLAMEAEITEEWTAMPALYAFVERIRVLKAEMENPTALPGHKSLVGTGLKPTDVIERCFYRGQRAHAKIILRHLNADLAILETTLKALERKNQNVKT